MSILFLLSVEAIICLPFEKKSVQILGSLHQKDARKIRAFSFEVHGKINVYNPDYRNLTSFSVLKIILGQFVCCFRCFSASGVWAILLPRIKRGHWNVFTLVRNCVIFIDIRTVEANSIVIIRFHFLCYHSFICKFFFRLHFKFCSELTS